MHRWLLIGAVLAVAAGGLAVRSLAAGKAGEGTLELSIVDQKTGKPVPCRVHLVNAAGVTRKVLGMPFWRDHFACPGQLSLKLPRGNYTFVIERGPEYTDTSGYFTINDFAEDSKTAELKRGCDMASEHWWSGDLGVRRFARDIELLMESEDLHVAVDVPPASGEPPAVHPLEPGLHMFKGPRYCWLLEPGEPEGGRLRIDLRPRPAEKAPSASDQHDVAAAAIEPDPPPAEQWWNDVVDPAAAALPLWLALGKVDSFCLLGGELVRGKYTSGKNAPSKKAARPRVEAAYTAAEQAEQVYFHILNCGLRVPPSAGSSSGVVDNPVGYNRMYAWVDRSQFTPELWWKAVRAGQVTVTNGPLIRPQANGRRPGHEFRLLDGKLELDVAMNLTTRDPITYMELVKNGRRTSSIRLADWAKTGHFPPVQFDEPGWLLVRVVTDTPGTYRAALSAPWYIEGPDGPRISRTSVNYFLERLLKLKKRSAAKQAVSATAEELAAAERFWTERLAKANAD